MTETENKPEEKSEKDPEQKQQKSKFLSSDWYDKNYKKLLVIELLLFLASVAYLGYFYSVNGDFMYKDTSLTGGTILTIYSGNISIPELNTYLQGKLADSNVRTLEDTYSRQVIAVIVETKESSDILKPIMESFLGYKLDNNNSSIEVTGASLSQSFYRELLYAMALAFLFMAIVVFIIFRKPIPSLAVIQAAVADIVFALTFANIFQFRISTAGIAALLMLIGYSVDTDIVLTTKVLKHKGEGTVNSRIKSSAKTGVIMSLTALCSTLLGFFISVAPTLKQIFFILAAGVFFDMIATWLGNASIVKWYCDKKHIE